MTKLKIIKIHRKIFNRSTENLIWRNKPFKFLSTRWKNYISIYHKYKKKISLVTFLFVIVSIKMEIPTDSTEI